MNLSDMWAESTDDLLIPILRHSDSFSSTPNSYDYTVEEYKEEKYHKPITEV